MYSNRDEINQGALIALLVFTVGAFLVPAILVPMLIRSPKKEKAG